LRVEIGDEMERTDEILREIVLPASIERVWDAVTDPREVSKWFGDITEIDLRPGGTAKFGWSEYGDAFEAVVVEVDKPHKFSYRWVFQPNTPYDESTARLVEMTLETVESGTRLTLAESGFLQLSGDEYQKAIDANSGGWESELADLVAYLAADTGG
jgi:uncharacterized protein YndB with AHSA1/START domain